MIVLKVNIYSSILELVELENKLKNRTPLMRELAAQMELAVQQNFIAGGRPTWQPLKYRNGQPLQKSGRLVNSITAYSDNDNAQVGTNVIYAAIQHFGGTTKPHIIRPRHKKALKFGGRYYKKVAHPGSVIPARTFLQLTNEDKTQLIKTAENFYRI